MRDHRNFLMFGISTTLCKSHRDRDVTMNMEEAVVGVSHCVIRGVILYLTTQNLNGSEICRKIVEIFVENVITKQEVFIKCFNYFLVDFATVQVLSG